MTKTKPTILPTGTRVHLSAEDRRSGTIDSAVMKDRKRLYRVKLDHPPFTLHTVAADTVIALTRRAKR